MTTLSNDALAEIIADHRRFLVGLAYRMLGSVAEAEDAVQEACVRVAQKPPLDRVALPSYLATTVTRICLDIMKSARKRREVYVGPWLPEPAFTDVRKAPENAAAESTLLFAESLSFALLAAMEKLSPLERAAFLLHDVFDFEYDVIAHTLEREPASIRQLVSRARQHLGRDKTRFVADDDDHGRLLGAFSQALYQGDTAALLALFHDGVTATSDGGGKVSAATRPVHGAASVATLLIGVSKRRGPETWFDVREINGFFNILWGTVEIEGTLAIDVKDGKIVRVDMVLNPEKLAALKAGTIIV
jgi:RNA polymerase sigma-70 factor (ECF subfamily)